MSLTTESATRAATAVAREDDELGLRERTRAVHRAFPTGVTVVTVHADDRPYGMTVNAFTSVSLDPPTVLFCVAQTAATHQLLVFADRVGINVLAHDQAAIARTFARTGVEKFDAISWRAGTHGSPLIDGAAAHLEVRIAERSPLHTHTIFTGHVIDGEVTGRRPLLFLGGALHDPLHVLLDG
jgi:flavin reductase (DIM6/NTAB) family NADH-FMN oxidoreductase RutF